VVAIVTAIANFNLVKFKHIKDKTMTNETTQYNYDVAKCNGVTLDKMIEIGPRGGSKTYWRAASKRNAWIATWHPTQKQAVKYADHFEAVVRN
jgi:hypothetical protein